MKRLNYTIFLMTLIIAMLSGCAQMGSGGTFDCPDADNDGICNQYEMNGSTNNLGGDTTPVECKKDDGSTVYLDCSLTSDCNCNGIGDNEEVRFVEKCGWGCVFTHARPVLAIGTALIGAYIAGQYLHWPFWDGDKKPVDNNGNVITLPTISSIAWDESYLKPIKGPSNSSGFLEIFVKGCCHTDASDEAGHDCTIKTRFEVIQFPLFSKDSPDNGGGTMRYNLNLKKSPVNNSTEQYIEVTDTALGKQYMKDPAWLNVPSTIDPMDHNFAENYIQLSGKNIPSTGYFKFLDIFANPSGPLGDTTSFYLDESPTGDNVLFYRWKRFEFPSDQH
jgi:hypothetical protein